MENNYNYSDVLKVSEVARLINKCIQTVRSYIKKNIYPNAYKKGEIWIIPYKDVHNYLYLDCTIAEAAIILKKSYNNVLIATRKGRFSGAYKNVNREWRIPYLELSEYSKCESLNTNEAAELLNLKTNQFLYYIKKGFFPRSKKDIFSTRWLVPKEDVEYFRGFLEHKNDYYSINDACKYLIVSERVFKNLLKNNNIDFAFAFGSNLFFTKEILDAIKKITLPNSNESIFMNELATDEKRKEFCEYPEQFIDARQIANILNLDNVYSLLKEGTFKSAVQIENRKWFAKREEIEEIALNETFNLYRPNGYLTFREAACELNISYKELNNILNSYNKYDVKFVQGIPYINLQSVHDLYLYLHKHALLSLAELADYLSLEISELYEVKTVWISKINLSGNSPLFKETTIPFLLDEIFLNFTININDSEGNYYFFSKDLEIGCSILGLTMVSLKSVICNHIAHYSSIRIKNNIIRLESKHFYEYLKIRNNTNNLLTIDEFVERSSLTKEVVENLITKEYIPVLSEKGSDYKLESKYLNQKNYLPKNLTISHNSAVKIFNLEDSFKSHFKDLDVLKRDLPISFYESILDKIKESSTVCFKFLSSIDPKFTKYFDKMSVMKDIEEILHVEDSFKMLWIEVNNLDNYKQRQEYEEIDYTPVKAFEYLNSHLESLINFPKTKNAYLEYCRLQINKTRGTLSYKITTLRAYILFYEKLEEIMGKELYLLTDEEINNLLTGSDILKKKQKILFTKFLSYLKTKIETVSRISYTVTGLKSKKQQDLYSSETFLKIFKHCLNIDLHLEKALECQSYSNMWVYVQMLCSDFIRGSDLISNAPAIEIEDLNSVLNEIQISKRLRQDIVQSIKKQLYLAFKNKRASKTNELLTFIIIPALEESLAIAFTISEFHRRKNNNEYQLSTFISNKYKKIRTSGGEQHLKFFEKDFYFSSLMMNRSIATYLYLSISEGESYNAELALILAKEARSHTHVESTKTYIQLMNNDGHIDKVSLNVFRRGSFGWLFNTLLTYLKRYEYEQLDLEGQTQEIESIREKLSLSDAENYANYVLNYLYPKIPEFSGQKKYLKLVWDNKQKIVHQIMKMSKEEISRILFGIATNALPSKHNHGQCLVFPSCKYPNNTNCYSCEYFIPQNLLLIQLKNEIDNVIEKIKIHDNEILIKRDSSFLINYLTIWNEAKLTFGNDHVSAYINSDNLKQSIQTISSKLQIN